MYAALDKQPILWHISVGLPTDKHLGQWQQYSQPRWVQSIDYCTNCVRELGPRHEQVCDWRVETRGTHFQMCPHDATVECEHPNSTCPARAYGHFAWKGGNQAAFKTKRSSITWECSNRSNDRLLMHNQDYWLRYQSSSRYWRGDWSRPQSRKTRSMSSIAATAKSDNH
jgi:hypothetical protein